MPPKDESRVVRISGDVAKRLEARGKFGQTFNDVIEQTLDTLDAFEKGNPPSKTSSYKLRDEK